jgi:hypothetical protein
MLPDLSFARLRFTYRLRDRLSHGLFQGSLWRGALGYALKKTICIYSDPFIRRCEECAFLLHCPYPPIFEPVTKGRLGGARNAPRPFVVEPPVYARGAIKAGSEVRLGMVLIGPALNNLPAISRAAALLGEKGLGKERARAALIRLEAIGEARRTTPFLRNDSLPSEKVSELWPDSESSPVYIYQAESFAEAAADLPSTLTLNFITPTRIKRQRKLVLTPDAETIVRLVLRRLIGLAQMYGTPWYPPTEKFIKAAAALPISGETDWQPISHVSSRQKQRMPLSGFQGRLTLHEVPQELRALLLLGSLLHIGKQATYGHGWYLIETENNN